MWAAYVVIALHVVFVMLLLRLYQWVDALDIVRLHSLHKAALVVTIVGTLLTAVNLMNRLEIVEPSMDVVVGALLKWVGLNSMALLWLHKLKRRYGSIDDLYNADSVNEDIGKKESHVQPVRSREASSKSTK